MFKYIQNISTENNKTIHLVFTYDSNINRCTYSILFLPDGTLNYGGEYMLFPSKDQRDWNKWLEEQNTKVPKIWSEIIVDKHSLALGVCLSPAHNGYYKDYHYEDSHVNFPIENQLLLFLKFINL